MRYSNLITSCVMLVLIFTFCGMLFPEKAYAGYLDPGSGSTLMQGIVAAVVAVKRFFARFTSLFSSKKDQ